MASIDVDMSKTLREFHSMMMELRRQGKAPFLKGIGSGRVRIMY